MENSLIEKTQGSSSINLLEEEETKKPREYPPLRKNLKTLIYLMKYMKIKITPKRLNNFFKKCDGRDKTNKVIQFLIQLFLLKFPEKIVKQKEQNNVSQETISWHLSGQRLAKNMSFTRKTLRLGHAIETYSDILESIQEYKDIQKQLKTQNSQEIKQTRKITKIHLYMNILENISNVLSFLNDFFDDMYFLSILKVIAPKWESIGDFYGSNLWLASITLDIIYTGYSAYDTFSQTNEKREFINMQENNANEENNKKELENLESLCIDKILQTSKWCADWIFCLCDCLAANNSKYAKYAEKYPQIQILSGLYQGLFSCTKHLKKSSLN